MQVHGRVEVEFDAGAVWIFLAGWLGAVGDNQIYTAGPSSHSSRHSGSQLLVGLVHLVGHINGVATGGDVGIATQKGLDAFWQDRIRCVALLLQHEQFDITQIDDFKR